MKRGLLRGRGRQARLTIMYSSHPDLQQVKLKKGAIKHCSILARTWAIGANNNLMF